MRPRAKMSPVGNHGTGTDDDFSEGVEFDSRPDGHLVADFQIPWVKNIHIGINPHRLANPCPKPPQDSVPATVEKTGDQTEEGTNGHPQDPFPELLRSIVFIRAMEADMKNFVWMGKIHGFLKRVNGSGE
jgi:hypothetical protein